MARFPRNSVSEIGTLIERFLAMYMESVLTARMRATALRLRENPFLRRFLDVSRLPGRRSHPG